jgi:hypothetical protein
MTAAKGAKAAQLAKDPTLCTDAGCELAAVIDGKCIIHAPMPEGQPAIPPAQPSDEEEISFSGSAALALAAVLLMTTGDVLANDGETSEEILGGLSAVTGMPLDVAAGLLLATTLLARTGELTAEVLQAAAERYTQQAQQED